jgi:hypothetical protein
MRVGRWGALACAGLAACAPAPAGARACPPEGACTSRCDEAGLVLEPPLPVLHEPTLGPGLGSDRLVRVALVVSRTHAGDDEVPAGALVDLARETLGEADTMLAACGVGLEVAGVAALRAPAPLSVLANEPGAWGGEAPEGQDADAFQHALGERIPSEARAWLEAARAPFSPGTIVGLVVDEVRYSRAGVETVAGGFAYAPVAYHHEDDVPTRNAVLLAGVYPSACGALPLAPPGRLFAHELGHMLLDTGAHEPDADNLMGAVGAELTPEQCQRVRDALTRGVFGEPPIVDPWPAPP